jgi:hypothetical protein
MNSAKELFWEFACNHFFIAHDGMMDEYLKLGGKNPEEEKIWRAEYIEYWINNFAQDELLALRKLGDATAVEALARLTNYHTFRDDWIKFWYAFYILELSNASQEKQQKQHAQNKADRLLRELIREDLSILPEHRAWLSKEAQEALSAATAEEYIKHYALTLLNREGKS